MILSRADCQPALANPTARAIPNSRRTISEASQTATLSAALFLCASRAHEPRMETSQNLDPTVNTPGIHRNAHCADGAFSHVLVLRSLTAEVYSGPMVAIQPYSGSIWRKRKMNMMSTSVLCYCLYLRLNKACKMCIYLASLSCADTNEDLS